MALIDALLDKVSDRALRRALREQVDAMLAKQSFGLVFQQHAPETVELHDYKVRRNCKVRIRSEDDETLYRVESVKAGTATVQSLVEVPERWEIPVDDLVVIREFGDPIYPGLRSTGTVHNGKDKPPHLVINAENFHALETLLYTHEGKFDAIYIDPPYNTRDKDWKYNNNYVDSDDVYRHSKWLAMMQRRLELAARLLNPDDSVLICAIDENELHRLALLLEQIFRTARIQTVSTLINPKGVSRGDGFRRADEYLCFVMLGSASPIRLPLSNEWSASPRGAMVEDAASEDDDVVANAATGPGPSWTSMMRRGTEARRADRPSMFYPIYADPAAVRIVEVGEPVPDHLHRAPHKKGLVAILPTRRDGSEGRWQIGRQELISRLEQGRVRLGRRTSYGYVVNYLPDGEYNDILSGKFVVTGRAADGSIESVRASSAGVDERVAPSQWKVTSHNASEYGKTLLSAFVPGREFPFPKSLYAVEDALRFFVGAKPNATVLDFFAGSGTTAHAVMRLNRQDGGRRRSICVTNNEVSAGEAEALTAAGHKLGDNEWEALGICRYITEPRLRAALTGRTDDGRAVKGRYKFIDGFPMSEGFEENVEFFDLTYEDPDMINLGRQFAAVAPLLWLRAGGSGARIDKPTKTWSMPDKAIYGILFDTDEWRGFVDAVIARPELIAHAFVVTDSDASFQQILLELPTSLEATQLYTDYIRTFEINTKGRV